MRGLIIALTCAVGIAHAQVPAYIAPIVPSPAGIVISAGKWLYDNFAQDRVFLIEVAGEGSNPDEARANGFRIAVEQAIGSLISSEAEAQNGRLVRDEIINYSAGYVTRYEILSTEPSRTGSRVIMKVWVKRSALANRLLNESKREGDVDGALAAVSFQTIAQERQTGTRLISSVMNDYPRRAFDVKIGKSQVFYNNSSTAQLQIPLTVKWSQHYLQSLWAALEATQHSNGCMALVTVEQGLFSGGTVRYNDDANYQLISNVLWKYRPQIRVDLIGAQNQVIATKIDGLPFNTPLFSIGNRVQRWGIPCNPPYQLVVNGGTSASTTVDFNLNPEILAQITRVNVEFLRQ